MKKIKLFILILSLGLVSFSSFSEEGEEEAVELDREEVADEVGLSLDDDLSFNRTDENIDIDEGELVEMFKELLVVDVPQVELDRAQERLTQDQSQRLEQLSRQQNAIRKQLQEMQQNGGLEGGDSLLNDGPNLRRLG